MTARGNNYPNEGHNIQCAVINSENQDIFFFEIYFLKFNSDNKGFRTLVNMPVILMR